jgi:hypothetical protein
MKVKYLKDLIMNLPNDMEVLYADPNFPGPYHCGPEEWEIKVEGKNLLISFPFEEPYE